MITITNRELSIIFRAIAEYEKDSPYVVDLKIAVSEIVATMLRKGDIIFTKEGAKENESNRPRNH